MAYVTLQDIKKQCNVDDDFTDDDNYLTLLGAAAQKVVENDICYSLEELEDENGEIPADIRCCILLVAASMYKNREMEVPVTGKGTPIYAWLIQPYINHSK